MAGSPPPPNGATAPAVADQRTLVEEASYTESCRRISTDFERLDDHLRAATLAIANSAEACPLIPGTSVRVVGTDTFGSLPGLRVFFRIVDADTCSLLYIEPKDESEE